MYIRADNNYFTKQLTSGSLVRGELSFVRIHVSIAARSYVKPSAATTGSTISSNVMGHRNSSRARMPRSRLYRVTMPGPLESSALEGAAVDEEDDIAIGTSW